MHDVTQPGSNKYNNMNEINIPLECLSNEIANSITSSRETHCKISVIIPVYNSQNYIHPCLKSLSLQTLPLDEFEIICVDDCSTDRSLAIIQKYQKSIPNLRLFKHENNSKQGAARNTGLLHARGEYITFLDSDDFLRLDALEILFNTVAGKSLVIAQHQHVRYDKPFDKKVSKRQVKSNLPLAGLENTVGWWPFGMLIKREILENNNIRFRENVFFEDIDFNIRTYCAASSYTVSNEVVYYYVQRDGSTVMAMSPKKVEDSIAAITTVFEFLSGRSKKEIDTFRESAQRWLCLQIRRICTTRASTHEKKELFSLFLLKLKQLNLEQILGEKVLTSVEQEFNTQNNTVNNKISSDVTTKLTHHQYLPWGNHFEERFKGKVIFFCEVDYHIRSAAPIARKLRELDIHSIIIDASRSTSFSTNRPLKVEEEKQYTDLDIFKINIAEIHPFATNAAAFIFMNDLTYTKQLIYENFGFGVPTIGFYEGINDDWNVDRQAIRRPYRSTDHLLLPGIYQKGFYQDRSCSIVGLPNVINRLKEPYRPPQKKLAIINVNFTYNVLEDRRDVFVDSAVRACVEAGIDYVISQHPADKGDLSQYNVGRDSIYDLLTKGSLLISRFSTTMLEALAMGRPIVYHNPINERVPKFSMPLGAFSKSSTVDSLKHAITREFEFVEQGGCIRSRAGLFLHFHTNSSCREEPDSQAAKAIANIVRIGNNRFNFKVDPDFNSIMSDSFGFQSNDSNELTLNKANRLMREGSEEKALEMYLSLYKQKIETNEINKPLLDIYRNNALFAARRLSEGTLKRVTIFFNSNVSTKV